MNLSRTITVNRTADHASKAARAYLQGIGYRPRPGADNRFERGSLLGSLTSFSPQKWRATAVLAFRRVDADRAEVRLDLNVNTTGQIVTEEECGYWEAELIGFEAAVTSGELLADEVTTAAQEVASEGRKFLGSQVVERIVAGLVAIALAFILSKCRF